MAVEGVVPDPFPDIGFGLTVAHPRREGQLLEGVEQFRHSRAGVGGKGIHRGEQELVVEAIVGVGGRSPRSADENAGIQLPGFVGHRLQEVGEKRGIVDPVERPRGKHFPFTRFESGVGDDFIPRLIAAFPLGVEFGKIVVVALPEPDPEGRQGFRRKVEVHGPVEFAVGKFVPQIVAEGPEPGQLGHVVFHGLFVGFEIDGVIAPGMALDGEFIPGLCVVLDKAGDGLFPVAVIE